MYRNGRRNIVVECGTSVMGKSKKEDEGRTAFALAKEEELEPVLLLLPCSPLLLDPLVYFVVDPLCVRLLAQPRSPLVRSFARGRGEHF